MDRENEKTRKARGLLRTWGEYIALRTVSAAASLLPEPAALLMADFLGWLMHLLDRRHRKVAAGNLAAAYPGKSPDEIRLLVRQVYRHLGMVVVESLRIRRMLTAGLERFVEKPDLTEVRNASAAGKGLIVATAHVGNWEIAGHAASIMFAPLNSVARPLDNPLLERYVDSMRRLSGQRILSKDGAVRDMLAVLKSGGAVAILLDQDARRHGIFVDFFGRPASTWPTAAALSLKLGSPIVIGFARRLGRSFRYRLIVDSVIHPQPTGDRDADVHALTQQITARIEARIRECPEQWFWVHRRWKTQPPAEVQR